MTTICAMQPYVFPYLPYFQLAHAVDAFWILDDVQYIRRGWMNRNRILLNGAPHQITFPVASGQRDEAVADKRLPDDFDRALARVGTTLHHAYGTARGGAQVLAMSEMLCARPWTRFLDFAMQCLHLVFDRLSLRTPLHFASTLSLPDDLRGQDRILEICARTKARAYVNPVGGRALYDPAAFAARGVALRFLDGHCPPYPQIGTTAFQPGLSILDLIAHLDPVDYAPQLAAFSLQND